MLRNLQSWSKFSTKWKESKSVLTNFSKRNHNDSSVEELINSSEDVNEVRLLGAVAGHIRVSDDLNSAAFTMVTVSKRGDGEKKSFHRISTFNSKMVENIKMNVSNGTRVYVSGTLIYYKKKFSGSVSVIIRPNKLILFPTGELKKISDNTV